MKMKENISEED